MSQLDQTVHWIRETNPGNIVAFTGAGISAESGVPTFRGASGLWKEYRAEDLATPQAFTRHPEIVWEWYEWRRALIRKAQPNAAHLALAKLEASRRGRFTLVTQNVDGLHERAGSRMIHELHGNMFRARCVRENNRFPYPDPPPEIPPRCDCGSLLRPDVVWFGEVLPGDAFEGSAIAMQRAGLVLVVGTSAVVYPAAGLIRLATQATIVEINPEPTPLSQSVSFSIQEKAGDAVPTIVDALLEVSS